MRERPSAKERERPYAVVRASRLRCATLHYVTGTDAIRAQLHRDYEEVCEAGLRRRPSDEPLQAAVDRLVAAELAFYEGDYLTLQRPEYGATEFPEESLTILQSHYARWLHAEQLVTGEQLLYGRNGFWQHWWNLLHERANAPLRMDLVLPDVPGMDEHNWVSQVRGDLIEAIVAAQAIDLRLIVPPREPDGSVRDIADYLTSFGFNIRVRSSPFLFAVYGCQAAVLSDREVGLGDSDEGYFLTRRPSIVAPLQRVFDEHWSSAIPWDSFTRGTADVLELMSLGWTDARIAQAMGLSMRTVSRRVADAMQAAGVSSRFELGMKYGQQQAQASR